MLIKTLKCYWGYAVMNFKSQLKMSLWLKTSNITSSKFITLPYTLKMQESSWKCEYKHSHINFSGVVFRNKFQTSFKRIILT